MSGSPVPPDNRRADWPRLVANKLNDIDLRVSNLQPATLLDLDGGTVSGITGNSFDFDGGGA